MKDIKQGVSKFTEKDLTPLETHVQSELEKIQAGHEGYKVVPVELWEEIIDLLNKCDPQLRTFTSTGMLDKKTVAIRERIDQTLPKLKSL